MEFDNLKSLKESVDELYKATVAETDELRALKTSMAHSRSSLQKDLSGGRFIDDAGRLVLSSPEIIIGDVDAYGVSNGSGSVVIRASRLSLEGTSEITIRAPRIRTLAVNPGADGEEASVDDVSEISMQARGISLQSDLAGQAPWFPDEVVAAPDGVIRLYAESGVEVSNRDGQARADSIKAAAEAAKTRADEAKAAADEAKARVEQIIEDIVGKPKSASLLSSLPGMDVLDSLFGFSEKYYDGTYEERDEFENNLGRLKSALNDYISCTMRYKTESCRNLGLGKYKYPLSDCQTHFHVDADQISFAGKGKDDSSFSVGTGNISLSASHEKGDKGQVSIFSENVDIVSSKSESDGSKVTTTPVGRFNVVAKEISIDAMTKVNDGKEVKDSAITEGSSFKLRAEGVEISTNNPDDSGNSTGKGKVTLTSKETLIQAQDFDKDGKADKLTDGGKITATAQTIAIGGANADEKTMSKEITMEADKVNVKVKTALSLAQNESDLSLNIKEKGLSLKGDKLESETKDATIKAATKIDGDLEVTGKAKVSKDVEAANVKAQSNVEAVNVKASASVKTPIVSK